MNSALPVSDNVHHHVGGKGVAPLGGKGKGRAHGFWIVGVDVEDGCADNLGEEGFG